MPIFENVPVVTHGPREFDPQVVGRATYNSDTGELSMTIEDSSFRDMVNNVYDDRGPRKFILSLSMLGSVKSKEAVMDYFKKEKNRCQ